MLVGLPRHISPPALQVVIAGLALVALQDEAEEGEEAHRVDGILRIELLPLHLWHTMRGYKWTGSTWTLRSVLANAQRPLFGTRTCMGCMASYTTIEMPKTKGNSSSTTMTAP